MSRPTPQTIKGPEFSDGDSNHRPDSDFTFPVNPESVLRTIAFKWQKKHLNDGQPENVSRSTTYTLDKLPAGYAVYGKQRIKGRVDKYIYGHPSHRTFSSTEQFFPHFCFLALYKDGDVCNCQLCERGGKRTEQKASRPCAANESSPGSLLSLSALHGKDGNLDLTLDERRNMDWRGESEIAHEVLHLVSRQPSFVPRVGELVLWCEHIDGEIRQDPSCGDFRIFDPTARDFIDYPKWMGGVITQTPISEQPVGFEDIVKEPEKEYDVTNSGFRIEWYAGPYATNKDFSKRYSHVPMHHIRPLAFWREYMSGIPNENWHPTVKNCLEAMGTLSTIKRYRMKSERPAAKVFSKGCFLGAEALYAGDVVRLILDGKCGVTEVFKIHAVLTRIKSIETSDGGILSGEKDHRIYIEFVGYAFTLDPRRSPTPVPIDPTDLQPVMRGYGPWYHYGLSSDMVSIDYSQVLGRLFERQAMDSWSRTVLDMGCRGVLEARKYATTHEDRAKRGGGFSFADSRAESLNLETFNGIDVGTLHSELELDLGQNVLSALHAIENEEEHHSPVAFDPKSGMMTGAPCEDSDENKGSSEEPQEDEDEMDVGQGTAVSATAVWNKKRDRPVEGDDNNEGSSDELQDLSLQKRGKPFTGEL